MQKVRIGLTAVILICCSFKVSSPASFKLEWLEMAQLESKLKVQSKPVLIDLYTDWCGWCKVMDRKTYANEQVIAYLNDKFYVTKINAEARNEISWKNKIYKYNSPYRMNDFALYLSKGQASFPTTVIIPDENADPIPIAGFMEPKQLEKIVKFFGDGAYKKMNFPQFERTFKASWK